MLRPFIPFVLLILCGPMMAGAQADLTGHWTNGWDEVLASKMGDSVWNFEGGNVHEGGYRFTLHITGDSTYLGDQGKRVAFRVVDGHRVLIFRTPAGVLEEIMTTMEPGQKLEDVVMGNKTAFELAGEYTDPRNGKKVIFYPGRPEVSGLFGVPDVYYFATPYDYPDNVLLFGKKKAICYARTDSSLSLATGIDHGDEMYSVGKDITTLRKTGWLDPSRSHLPGRYPFASAMVMTHYILKYFSPAELRIMRNEIYARHGYIFKSSDLQAWFMAQPWYKPVEGAGESQLSELEKLNAQTISAEATRHRDR